MSRSRRDEPRAPSSYGRARWAARVVRRNIAWLRTQGVRQLVEEHELHPVRNAVSSLRKARWRRAHHVPPGSAAPVFLFGLPRSGTNMMVRGLDTAPEFEVYNDGDRRAFRRHHLRGDEVVRDLVVRSRHRYVLFKPFLDNHRILTLLDGLDTPTPPRVLWAYRDVDGRARSALRKFGPAASNALRDIAAGRGSHHWQARGLSDESLDVIRTVDWDRAGPGDGAALLWYVVNQQLFELGLDRREDVLPVSYDAMVSDPQGTMRGVCRFLGMRWDVTLVADVDERSRVARDPLPLDPRIRELCGALAARLDEAADRAVRRA
jgi:Sulfotransferase family